MDLLSGYIPIVQNFGYGREALVKYPSAFMVELISSEIDVEIFILCKTIQGDLNLHSVRQYDLCFFCLILKSSFGPCITSKFNACVQFELTDAVINDDMIEIFTSSVVVATCGQDPN